MYGSSIMEYFNDIKIKHHLKFILLFLILSLISCVKRNAYYYQISFDKDHKVIGRLHVKEADPLNSVAHYRLSYDNKGKLRWLRYYRRGRLWADPYLGLIQLQVQYFDEGERWIFLDEENNPIPNVLGVYSLKIYAKKNRKINVFSYDKEDNLTKDNEGVAHRVILFDKKRNAEILLFDENGNRVISKSGFYRMELKYDKFKRVIEMSNYDAEGRLLDPVERTSIIQYNYDRFGNKFEERYLGADKELKSTPESGIAVVRAKFNDHGFLIEKTFYGIDNLLKKHNVDGCAILQDVLNEWDELVETRCIDEHNQLAIRHGCSIAKIKRDFNGNVRELSCFDKDGKLNESEFRGCEVNQYKYNDMGWLIRYRCLDADRNLKNDKDGVAFSEWEYTKDETEFKIKKYDKNGKIVAQP